MNTADPLVTALARRLNLVANGLALLADGADVLPAETITQHARQLHGVVTRELYTVSAMTIARGDAGALLLALGEIAHQCDNAELPDQCDGRGLVDLVRTLAAQAIHDYHTACRAA